MRTITLFCLLTVVGLSLIGKVSNAEPTHVSLVEEIDSEIIDETDSLVRENPVIETDSLDDDPGITVPDFINTESNKISLNGADWSDLRKALKMVGKTPFSVLHIGDSHLQADISTGTIRDLLQYDYGNAGRGLLIPFKMAGTNQPWDYSISSMSKWHSEKLLRRPWNLNMRLTGIAIKPMVDENELFIGTRDDDDYDPFNAFTIIHSGDINISSIVNRNGDQVQFTERRIPGGTRVSLAEDENGVTVAFESNGLTINGLILDGNRPGIFYHAIGNNGATYASYSNIPHFGADIRMLHPQLIIISLGTNEAYGSFNERSFTESLNRVVKEIQRTNPTATLLLTTPMESQKSYYTTTYTTVKRKVGRGKKRRTREVRVPKRVHHYGANNTIREVRDAIINYGRKNHIAVYDWYSISGGEGASTIWLNNGLYGHDRVHNTAKGYRLSGFMLYSALRDMLTREN